jgi:2'-5' RNA ligase
VTRLFIAAWPDDRVIAQLSRLERPDELGVRWVRPANLHVTLRFLGDVDIDEVAARLTDASLPAATARLGPRIEAFHRRQVVVRVTGVDELAGAVQSATSDIGRIDDRPFQGHVTLARLRAGATTAMTGRPVQASFGIDEIAIVSSELGAEGAVYTTVATMATS